MSRLKRLAAVLGLVVALGAACTPQQMAYWLESNGQPVPKDPAELAAMADWATQYWNNYAVWYSQQHTIGWPWNELAQCEAGGNWHINTGNGYYGGLQFLYSTWQAYGGGQYAAYPHQAEPWQQVEIGKRVVAASGGRYTAWPACRAALGLP